MQRVETPSLASDYIKLTLKLYNYGKFEKVINFANEGIKKHPNSALLYNNLCAAYNKLGDWQKGAEAGKKGLEIDPSNQLLKNNYNWSVKNLSNLNDYE